MNRRFKLHTLLKDLGGLDVLDVGKVSRVGEKQKTVQQHGQKLHRGHGDHVAACRIVAVALSAVKCQRQRLLGNLPFEIALYRIEAYDVEKCAAEQTHVADGHLQRVPPQLKKKWHGLPFVFISVIVKITVRRAQKRTVAICFHFAFLS